MENTLEFVHGLHISTTELLYFRQYNLTGVFGRLLEEHGLPLPVVKKEVDHFRRVSLFKRHVKGSACTKRTSGEESHACKILAVDT